MMLESQTQLLPAIVQRRVRGGELLVVPLRGEIGHQHADG
jgi:hypothetical protein